LVHSIGLLLLTDDGRVALLCLKRRSQNKVCPRSSGPRHYALFPTTRLAEPCLGPRPCSRPRPSRCQSVSFISGRFLNCQVVNRALLLASAATITWTSAITTTWSPFFQLSSSSPPSSCTTAYWSLTECPPSPRG
jgi:hypothetical protein